jgi:Ca2+-binding RTX toxin-like protein
VRLMPRTAATTALALLAGLALTAVAAPASAASTTGAGTSGPATKTVVRSTTLATSDQGMWGTGASTPTDTRLTLFHETWDETGSFGAIDGGCLGELCAYFGGSFAGSVKGEIGMSIRLEGLEGGTVSVTYPVTVTFTAPADSSFDPGATVDIRTSMTVDASQATITASFPELDRVALDGVLKASTTLNGTACFIACVGPAAIIPAGAGFDSSSELLGLDPGELSTCFTTLPLGFPWLLSDYPNDRCGDKGYFFSPDVDLASTFDPADGTIRASGTDRYAILPVNVLPGGGTDVDLGAATISWTVFKAIITAIETIEQDLLFTPRVDVDLDWGKTLGFEVLDGAGGAALRSGSGTHATFAVGDTLRLTTNALNNEVIPVTPTLSMGSATMSNRTRNASTTVARLEALAFHVITFDADGDVDSEDGFGPVYEESFPVGTTRADVFDGSFAVGGFNAPELDPFTLVPRPVVELRKDVVPANAPGRFHLRVDGTTVAADVGDEGTSGRLVLEPGTRVLSETAGTGGDLALFDTSVTCVHRDGGAVHTQAAGGSPGLGASADLVLTGGEDLVCTVRNRLPAASECDAMVFDNVIVGTPGRDTLRGTNRRDMIIGYGGDDVIESGSGNDCVSGNAGNDRVELGAGDDVGDAGAGHDRLGAGAGNDVVHGGDGNDLLEAGAGNDRVLADAGDDVVTGGDGVDDLAGAGGNDTLTGGNEDDRLDGGLGTDAAHGSNGLDVCLAETRTSCEGPGALPTAAAVAPAAGTEAVEPPAASPSTAIAPAGGTRVVEPQPAADPSAGAQPVPSLSADSGRAAPSEPSGDSTRTSSPTPAATVQSAASTWTRAVAGSKR